MFLGIHSVRIFFPRRREQLIASIGTIPWRIIYSVISLGSLGLIIYGYSLTRGNAELLYAPLSGLYKPILVVMAVALILFVASDFGSSHIKRIVRHPLLVGVLLWSLVHLAMNGDAASLAMFGSFLLWSVLSLFSAIRRSSDEQPPAIIRNDILSVVVGLALFALIMWKLHGWLIGVQPII